MGSSATHRSSAIVKLLVAYSVGETGGIVGDDADAKKKNIYFNDTPMRTGNADNFEGATFDERFGTAGQSVIKGFSNTTSVVTIGTQLTKDGGPITRVVSSANVDSVRVVISFPQLAEYHDEGTDQIAVELKFEVKDPSTGTWTNRGTKKFEGKSFVPLEVDYEIDGPATITGPWSIRITRLTDDSVNKKYANDTYVQRIIEVIESKETYPNTALVGFRFDIDRFGGNIPTVSMKVKGIKVRVPANYYESIEDAGETPPNLNASKYPLYEGEWDGTFKWAVTSNPAWHFYHLAYEQSYGAGIDRNYLDKWSLYTIAKYCDAVSPAADAEGNYLFVGVNWVDPDAGNVTKKRRRFTLNTVLTDPTDALTMLQNIASAFRGLAYYGAGAFVASQDCPRDVDNARIITNESVLEGKFHYQTSDMKQRTTIARVTYNDRDDHYRPSFVQWPEEEDLATDDGYKRYGRNVLEVTKFGCDNAAEAAAYAKFITYTAQNETRNVMFTVGPEHSTLRPGEVIRVFDRRFMKERWGGRMLAGSTGTKIMLDAFDENGTVVAPVVLASGKNYQIIVVGNDGKTVYTRNITSGAGTRTEVNCQSFGFTPTPGYSWAIFGTDIAPQTFRVAHLVKKSALEYEVKATQYDPQKFAAVEQGKTPKPVPYIRDEYVIVNAPTNIVFKRRGVEDPTVGTRNDLTVGWTASTSRNIKHYTYMWRKLGENWSVATDTKATSFVIRGVTKGMYEVRIRAENVQGRQSLTAEAQHEVTYLTGGDLPTIYPPQLHDPV